MIKIETFKDYGIEIPYRRTHGQVKCVCPNCQKTNRTHKEDKSLSVDIDNGLFNCHYCGFSGALKGYDRSRARMKRREYVKPQAVLETGLSQRLINYFASRGIGTDTLKKMHIAEGMEFMPQANEEMNTVQFPYFLDGELINIKYRTGDKKFKMVQGAELIPYNIDSIKGCDTAFICEGEFDCLSFVEAGFNNVISVPNGANKNLEWLDDFLEGYFDDKETIYIAVDNDEKGILLRDELVRRFGPERCMIVNWSSGCKDANDQLKTYGKDSLRYCVERAHDVKIGGVFYLDDYEDNLDLLYRNGAPKGCTVGWTEFDELISFTSKRIMVVTGTPGSGKSQFMVELAIRLNLRYGWKTAFFSPESQPMESHAQELIQVVIGKSFSPNLIHMDEYEYAMGKDYVRKNFFHIMPEDNQTVSTILEKAEFLVRRRGIKMLVIDPYSSIDTDFGTQSETNYIRAMLEAMRNFAIRNDLLVVLVAHPTKMRKDKDHDGVPTMYDVSGSAHFLNKTDYGVVVHRFFDEDYTLVKVEKIKSRFLGKVGSVTFKFNINNGRYVPWHEDYAMVSWDNSNWLAPNTSTTATQKLQEDEPQTEGYGFTESNEDFLMDKSDYVPF